MTGTKFGLLTILFDLGTDKFYHRKVLALCECGNITTVALSLLKSGKTKSCGCLKHQTAIINFTSHGLVKHKLYGVWLGIKKRCYNIAEPAYKDYGARGIIMCDEWKHDFLSFYNWAIANGWEKGLEIDRRENNGIYEPGNCRFVTRLINAKNKRSNRVITYNGETMILSDWARKLHVSFDTLRYRIRAGWPIEKAFSNA